MTDKISFEGRVVIVTGAGGGLGSAYAKELAKRGAAVVVNDLGGAVRGGGASTGYADAVVEDIKASGGRAIANYDSVATVEGGNAIVAAALDQFGRIDAVINNAGNMRFGGFEDMTLEDLNALHAVHVGGSWNVTRAAWPHMKAQGYGRIIFTTSSGGMFGSAQLNVYGAAKGGVAGLFHSIAHEGAPLGIICNALMPNAVSRMALESAESITGNVWSGQFPQTFDPTFTAGLVAYLASENCTTHNGIYSALGGRIGRAFVGVTTGHQGSITIPLTAEEIAANWSEIGDENRGYAIPADIPDEFRIVAEAQSR